MPLVPRNSSTSTFRENRGLIIDKESSTSRKLRFFRPGKARATKQAVIHFSFDTSSVMLSNRLFFGGSEFDATSDILVRHRPSFEVLNLNRLSTINLKEPISIVVEFDEIHFLAQSVDLPIYAIGDTASEALANLRHSLEDLYFELISEENLSDEWIQYKDYLQQRIKQG